MNDDNIAALREQLQRLQARRDAGELGQKDYDKERARLERALLAEVMAQPQTRTAALEDELRVPPPAAAVPAAPRPGGRLIALMSVAVLAVAIVGYSFTGSPSLATGKVPVAQSEASPHQGANTAEQFAAAVEQLAAKLKEQPDNLEGWTMLARSYMRMGRVADALPAYEKALALKGDNAALLIDYADAMAVNNDRNLEGQPLALIERALKIDPDNLKGLALAGTAAFNRKDYALAVKHWERLAAAAPPDTPWREQVQQSIAEARELGKLGPATATAKPSPPAPQAAAGGGVRGTVKLAPSVAAKASPEDTVFILARAAEGPRMPLAIVRKQVKDLPLDFSLDDAMAMSPAMKISAFPRVVIDARVSKSGQAQPAAGDLAGRSPPIANNASGVVVEINEVVAN